MERLTATEAARRFSEVLDAVERRRMSFVVVRRGKAVATIAPAAPATGASVKTILRGGGVDPAWAEDLRAFRAMLSVEESARNA